VTTLISGSASPVLGERLATVYYPANPATLSRVTQFSYTEASTLPASLQGILPPQFDSTTTINASRDAPGSPSGPYPVVLFSHGFGGERLYYSNLLAGMASWGYVVVSADYLERGLAAQALRVTVRPSATLDRSIMLDSLSAVEKAAGDPSSVIHGVVNPQGGGSRTLLGRAGHRLRRWTVRRWPRPSAGPGPTDRPPRPSH
jgi:hypothetical protein